MLSRVLLSGEHMCATEYIQTLWRARLTGKSSDRLKNLFSAGRKFGNCAREIDCLVTGTELTVIGM
jgi:hypothetical protein